MTENLSLLFLSWNGIHSDRIHRKRDFLHMEDQEQKPSLDGEFSIVIILPLQLNLNFSSFQGTSVVTQDQKKGTLLITRNLFAVVVQRPFEETKMASVVRVCVKRRFMWSVLVRALRKYVRDVQAWYCSKCSLPPLNKRQLFGWFRNRRRYWSSPSRRWNGGWKWNMRRLWSEG